MMDILLHSQRYGLQDIWDVVPKTHKCAGDRAFSVAAPQLWNKLPIYIRRAPNVDTFKTLVKTYLFKISYVG